MSFVNFQTEHPVALTYELRSIIDWLPTQIHTNFRLYCTTLHSVIESSIYVTRNSENFPFENNFLLAFILVKYEYVYFRLELFIGSLHKSCWPRKNGLSITTVTKFISSWEKMWFDLGIFLSFQTLKFKNHLWFFVGHQWHF